VEARTGRTAPAALTAAVQALGADGAAIAHTRELVAMARSGAGSSLLVEVKAVDAAYPLYGAVRTLPGAGLARLLEDGGAVVEESLLARLGVAVGEPVAIGEATVTVRAVLTHEPDRPTALVSLGPRVFVSHATLDRSGLVGLGSRLRERWLLRLPPAIAPAAARARLAAAVDDPSVRVAVYDEAQPALKRFLRQLGTYLGLVGLVSLLVGGVGVAASVATFMRRRRAAVAVLRCLGADARTLLVTYVAQTQLLGVAGSALGALLGAALLPLLVVITRGFLPFAIEGRADPGTIARGIVMGGAITLLCALWPLLRLRDVRPAEVLRADVDAHARRGRRPWLAALPIAGGLAVLAIWQAGSWKIGGIFVGAALVALVMLAALGRGVVVLARRVPRRGALAWRQGVSGLMRPGGQVAGIVVALGVGVMLLVAVALLEASLDAQLDHELRRQAPSFFFVDIQADQREPFARVVAEVAGVAPRLTPIVRARLAAVGEEPVTRALVDRRRAEGAEKSFFLIREYAITSAAELPEGNRVIAGRWWTEADAAARPRVSIEEDMAVGLRVGVGDTIAFDVQGVRVDAEVTSIRQVDWQSLTTNFFAILSPGALDGAPTTWVATARVPPSVEAPLQDRVVTAFPNITAVPVRDVLERVAGLLAQMAFAIRGIAGFSIAAGLVVMIAALTATRAQRLYESVILRTLGATRGVVARAFAVEYACLGATAGVGGTVLAAALSWIVLRYLLDTPWQLSPWTLAAGVVVTTVLSVAVGFLTTWRLLGQKPLPVLRRE
jgi:putative ABC transport system permease protein